MNDMIEVKTSELTGAALDWSVATAQNLDVYVFDQGKPYCYTTDTECLGRSYSPSTQWDQAGPMIENYKIDFAYEDNEILFAYAWGLEGRDGCGQAHGDTHLIAACRAIVAAKLGDTFSVPRELMPCAKES